MHIYLKNGAWHARWRAFGKHCSQRLGPDTLHKTEAEHLAHKLFAQEIRRRPEGDVTLAVYVNATYLPYAAMQLNPSTLVERQLRKKIIEL